MHEHALTQRYTYKHIHKSVYMHSYIYTYICTQNFIPIHAPSYTYIHVYTYFTHTPTYICTLTHALVFTHLPTTSNVIYLDLIFPNHKINQNLLYTCLLYFTMPGLLLHLHQYEQEQCEEPSPFRNAKFPGVFLGHNYAFTNMSVHNVRNSGGSLRRHHQMTHLDSFCLLKATKKPLTAPLAKVDLSDCA